MSSGGPKTLDVASQKQAESLGRCSHLTAMPEDGTRPGQL